jgi:hypothetical protein
VNQLTHRTTASNHGHCAFEVEGLALAIRASEGGDYPVKWLGTSLATRLFDILDPRLAILTKIVSLTDFHAAMRTMTRKKQRSQRFKKIGERHASNKK